MSPFMREIIGGLDALDWENLNEAHKGAEGLLAYINSRRELLHAEFLSHSFEERLRRTRLSHETSTHFKWYMHRSAELGYEIWLHEYKSKEFRKPGYAEVPHNHRYWFTSLILTGSFKHHIYRVERAPQENLLRSMTVTKQLHYNAGDIYTNAPDVVHSIFEIEEPTLTLLIRSRAVKLYSESFNSDNNKITRYYPFSARIGDSYPFANHLLAKLSRSA